MQIMIIVTLLYKIITHRYKNRAILGLNS